LVTELPDERQCSVGKAARGFSRVYTATTWCTSGMACINRVSIADFNVSVALGHPLQAPFMLSSTIPSW